MIKKYNSYIKEKNEDDLPSYMSDELDYGYAEDDDYVDTDSSSEQNEEMENLVYWIRTLFSNSSVKADIELDGLDISIYCTLNTRSSLKEIINILDVTNKLSKDILSQYSSKMDVFETNKGEKLMVFDFFYDDLDINLPF